MTNNSVPQLPLSELFQTVIKTHCIDDYKEIKPIHLAGLIDPSADAVLNARILRNYGHRLANPKPQRKRQPSKSKRNFNAGNLSSQFLTVGGA